MATLISIPILGVAVILQSTIISQFTLLHGTADLVMVVLLSWLIHDRVKATWEWAVVGGFLFGIISGLPFWLPLLIFLLVTGGALYLRQRVWQVPILALFTTILFGTIISHTLTYGYLRLSGSVLPLGQVFNLITLPSMLLNLLLAIPIFGIIGEIARWFYPLESDEV